MASNKEREERIALREERRKLLKESKNKKNRRYSKIKEEKDNSKDKKLTKLTNLEVIVVIIVCISIGIIAGLRINSEKAKKNNKAFDSYAFEVYNDVKDNYYGLISDDMDRYQIAAILKSLNDSHAMYLVGANATAYKEQLKNEFVGIGVEVQMMENGDIIFINIFDGSPAKKAGILENDVLLKIDDKETKGLSVSEVASLIKGDTNNKKVKLTVSRDGEEKEFTIKKKTINPDSVTVEYINNDSIAVVSISSFTSTTLDEFRTAMDKVKEKGIKNVAIDVRDNNFGYMSVASDIASLFLEKGTVIYKEKYNKGDKTIKSMNNKEYDFDIAVVINDKSSKASEMLACALKDQIGAKIIGKESNGDSTIQKTLELKNGDIVVYTVGKWLTSQDASIARTSVIPNYQVLGDDYNSKIIEAFNNSI